MKKPAMAGNRVFLFVCAVTFPVLLAGVIKVDGADYSDFVMALGAYIVGIAALWGANDAGGAAKIWASKTERGQTINEQVLSPNPAVEDADEA